MLELPDKAVVQILAALPYTEITIRKHSYPLDRPSGLSLPVNDSRLQAFAQTGGG